MSIFWYLALMALQYALQPKPEEPKAASIEDFEAPTSDENREKPVLYGTDDITGPHVAWYGHLRSKKIKKRAGFSKVTVGHQYYLGMHFALSHQLEELQAIWVGGRLVWSGAISSGDGYIDKWSIFGGKDQEGGVQGNFTFLNGDRTQGVNSYLAARFGSQCPAFRGTASLVWKQGYIGTSRYLKKWSFRAHRTGIKPDGSAQWYPTKAAIGDQMNPAHIIREILTGRYGAGRPESMMLDAEFTAAADALYSEGFGISLQWVRSEPVSDFIDRILAIVDGVRTRDKATGAMGMKLNRDDYDPLLLPVYDETHIQSVDVFERRSWSRNAVNQMTIVYYDPATRQEATVTLQDTANVDRQGKVVPQKKTYKPIRSHDLARRVCARELKAVSAPISKATLTIDTTGKKLSRGSLFRYAPKRLSQPDAVFRVMEITHNEDNGSVTVEVIEDLFSLPDTAYVEIQPTGWTEPLTAPVAVVNQLAVEASYWDVVRDHEAGIIAGYAAGFGIAHLMAAAPQDDAYAYDLWAVDANPATDPYLYVEEAEFTPTATLTAGIDRSDRLAISIDNGDALDDVEVGTVAYIGQEMVVIEAINLTSTTDGTIDIGRGVVDTVPIEHSAGERIWFANDTSYGESSVESDGETVYLKALTKNGQGDLDEASASQATVVLDQRYQRPYPPGLIRFNGAAWPSAESGDLAITWAHRDRVTQGTGLVDQDQASIGPEAGTIYTIRIIDPTGPTTVHTESGLSGTSWTYTQAARQADFGGVGPHDIRVEIESLRDGLTSRQMHTLDLTVNDV